MVEAFHKTCNIKHEIDIKRYGNTKKSETDSCQCFCFGLSFCILSYFSLKSMRILIFNKASNNHVHRLLSHLEYGGTNA